MVDPTPIGLSIKVALVATSAVVPPGIALAWWLSHGKSFRGKAFVDTLISLPLVLPPTVVGFYLLSIFGRGTSVGRFINDTIGVRILFTWQGASVAAAIMSFPLFVKAAATAFANVDEVLLEAGRSLGANDFKLLTKVILPMSYRGLISALTLTICRALGEFGATILIGGSISGQTETLPLALFSAVEQGKNDDAMVYTAILSLTAFAILGGTRFYEAQISAARRDR